MSLVAYVLKEELKARPPTRWESHVRFAIRLPDEEIQLPIGTWLLELPTDTGSSQAALYQLADGTVVCMENPLTADQVAPLTDAQALTSLSAFRTLTQAMRDDHGLAFEPVSGDAPFRIIQCPLCRGTAFTTVAFSSVWCDSCNAKFIVRYTAGDPGFVVDCTWEHVSFRDAYYLMPRTTDLQLTMVFKSGGDPLDLTHDPHCHRQDCTETQVALTNGKDSSVRPGLHACALGDVYDWSFYGRVPTAYKYDTHGHHDLVWPLGEKESWPKTAFVPVTGFAYEEKQVVPNAVEMIRANVPESDRRQSVLASLQLLVERPARAPASYRSPWLQPKYLAEGEKYLLHRWLISQEKGRLATAVPVWLVVKDVSEEGYGFKWQVVRDDICPQCGEPAAAADWAHTPDPKRPWTVPHGHCRQLWQKQNWRPTLFADVEEILAPVG